MYGVRYVRYWYVSVTLDVSTVLYYKIRTSEVIGCPVILQERIFFGSRERRHSSTKDYRVQYVTVRYAYDTVRNGVQVPYGIEIRYSRCFRDLQYVPYVASPI